MITEMVYRIDVTYADDPEGNYTESLTAPEIIAKYPWLARFLADMNEGLFTMTLVAGLVKIKINWPTPVPV